MSRHSRAMLLNVLWHHQGGSSPVGQPIRSIVGLGQHDRMTDEQVAEAKWIDGLLAAPQPAIPEGYVLVPVEPTDAMLEAALRANMQHVLDCLNDPKKYKDLGSEETCKQTYRERYRSMIAAAKEPK